MQDKDIRRLFQKRKYRFVRTEADIKIYEYLQNEIDKMNIKIKKQRKEQRFH